MQRKVVRIDYRFPYPVKCSAAQLKVVLHKLAGQWHGWERFPWRVTRNLHRFLLKPPVNFHYLMIHDCLEGFAAHLVLTSQFVNRDAVIEMMVRERFEVVGLLRVLLIDALRAEVKWSGVPYILDASGPEDGHKHVPTEEIERRRACFRKCVEAAVADFVAILNGASLSKGLRGEMFGRTLRRWAEGELPETESLTVQLEESMSGTMLRPCEEEVTAIAEAGRTIPAVVLEARERGEARNAEGGAPGGAAAVSGPGSAVVAGIVGDYTVVRFSDGFEVNLSQRAKPRFFLRFVKEWCAKRGTQVFLYEEVREEYNRANPDRQIHSDRLDHDLFRNVAGATRLFETLDKAAQRFRLLI